MTLLGGADDLAAGLVTLPTRYPQILSILEARLRLKQGNLVTVF